MIETVVRIDRSVQAVKSQEGKYLTFAFLEKDGAMQLEVVGWTSLQLQQYNSGILQTVHLWDHEIPLKNLDAVMQYGKNRQLTDTACILIFEYSEPHRKYLAILVDGISNVMTIAAKDASTAIVSETVTVDESGNRKFEYNLIATDASDRQELI